MKRVLFLCCLSSLLPLGVSVRAADAPVRQSPKKALQALNDLIGAWRGTGEPKTGTREEQRRGFWQEKIIWEWQFKGDDVYLRAAIDKGKYFTHAELRYLPDKDHYRLTAKTPAKETLVFEGTLNKKCLTLDRKDDKKNETQRLIVNVLHFNRYLLRYEVKPAARTTFALLYQVGATKEGVEFAGGDDAPECIVSGGLGTMAVVYKGQTYYVCCSGCRDAFKDEPEKYIKEFEAKKKAKKEQTKRH
ncbi:MAG TPA: YHS domain-containing protein [Gemmataceae bacterium]|nr:YHS domain-containing protein [Gemmataceae bacterium]